MIEELIAEERELQALSQRQAVTEEQQSQQLRRKQRDELIDKLVLLLLCFSHTSQSQLHTPWKAWILPMGGYCFYSHSPLSGCCRPASGYTVRGVSERGPLINRGPHQIQN